VEEFIGLLGNRGLTVTEIDGRRSMTVGTHTIRLPEKNVAQGGVRFHAAAEKPASEAVTGFWQSLFRAIVGFLGLQDVGTKLFGVGTEQSQSTNPIPINADFSEAYRQESLNQFRQEIKSTVEGLANSDSYADLRLNPFVGTSSSSSDSSDSNSSAPTAEGANGSVRIMAAATDVGVNLFSVPPSFTIPPGPPSAAETFVEIKGHLEKIYGKPEAEVEGIPELDATTKATLQAMAGAVGSLAIVCACSKALHPTAGEGEKIPVGPPFDQATCLEIIMKNAATVLAHSACLLSPDGKATEAMDSIIEAARKGEAVSAENAAKAANELQRLLAENEAVTGENAQLNMAMNELTAQLASMQAEFDKMRQSTDLTIKKALHVEIEELPDFETMPGVIAARAALKLVADSEK
jgi:hypothetical protein